MAVAAIDIGTNSVRLLIVHADGTEERRQRVTGLGRGVDATGRMSPDAIDRTIQALSSYADRISELGARCRAVATSASRDAMNAVEFLERAEGVLGARPDVISGEEEARLSFEGATARRSGSEIVVDIGGGSTEFCHDEGRFSADSVDMGSVRITDRHLPRRPAPFDDLERAASAADDAFAHLSLPERPVIGVAGTWTSLADIATGSPGSAERAPVTLGRIDVDRLVARLSALTIPETERLDGLDPARAPVILGGAIVARSVMRRLGTDRVTVDVRDLLDGIVARL